MKNWDPRYDALLYRPHPISAAHPAMPMRERAAQFAAFKALTGFEEEIEEEGRYTEHAAELDEERKTVLNGRLCRLMESGGAAVFVWFSPDGKKEGGSYRWSRGAIRKIDELEQMLCLDNGRKIPLARLYDIREDAGDA